MWAVDKKHCKNVLGDHSNNKLKSLKVTNSEDEIIGDGGKDGGTGSGGVGDEGLSRDPPTYIILSSWNNIKYALYHFWN